MVNFVLRPILIGLATAFILLLTIPSLRNNLLPSIHSIENFDDLHLSFNHAVKKASPAVVNIYSQQFTEGNRLTLRNEGLGSGVILSDKGYIITNFHVVAQADQILVALQDSRIANAQLIGSDRQTDIAILKIDLPNLPVIPQNPNYKEKVGDIVLAIGNPYNLGQTTTFGIISATGRSSISANGRQAFIQTDAAINKGNSGGALVNSKGELVGINTASFQQVTDLETYGISFAIPYSLAHKVMNKIISDGRVIRGYIGIEAQDINMVLARLLGLKQVTGIIISDIKPDSPAQKAGLQKQDVIIGFNNQKMSTTLELIEMVTESRPGTKVELQLIRDGKEMTKAMIIEEDPAH